VTLFAAVPLLAMLSPLVVLGVVAGSMVALLLAEWLLPSQGGRLILVTVSRLWEQASGVARPVTTVHHCIRWSWGTAVGLRNAATRKHRPSTMAGERS
jgi:hypothetical protein